MEIFKGVNVSKWLIEDVYEDIRQDEDRLLKFIKERILNELYESLENACPYYKCEYNDNGVPIDIHIIEYLYIKGSS